MDFSGGTPFGCSWDELDLDRLSRFFDDQQDDEAFTWEAKATSVHPRHVRIAASAFGNSVLGGFLVIGAEYDKKTRSWSLPGWEFPDEPQVWIKNIITNIDGWPPFDTRPFPIGSAHVAVVISVRPLRRQ